MKNPTNNQTNTKGGQIYELSSDYPSYDQVPFYRKTWFVVLVLLFFWPALLVIVLTGNFYKKDRKSGAMYSTTKKGRNLFMFVCLGLFVMGLQIVLL